MGALHRRWLGAVLLIAFAALAAPAMAQQVLHPSRGSPLRAQLLDAARPAFEADTNGAVEFVVRRLNVLGDWAFGDVRLQRPGGRAIDWARTKHASDFKQGTFDPGGSFFLLHRQDGAWSLTEYASGPTDVIWDGWRMDHKLPRILFERNAN